MTLATRPDLEGPEETKSPIRRVLPDWDDMLSTGQAHDIIGNTLQWSGLVIIPSDCGYALMGMPGHPEAMTVLDHLLQHSTTATPLTVATAEMAFAHIECSLVQKRIMAHAWPGGVTVVGKVTRRASKLTKSLHTTDTLGLRVSRSHIERQLSAEAALALTSAAIRLPDGSVARTYEEAAGIVTDGLQSMPFSKLVPIVGIPHTTPFVFSTHSTVMGLGAGGAVDILREGTVDRRTLISWGTQISPAEYSDAT